MSKKPTLIVPCCGSLSYGSVPAYLAFRPDGRFMLELSMDAAPADEFDRTIIVVPVEHLGRFRAAEKLARAFGDRPGYQLLALDQPTAGPAATVMAALEKCNVEGPIVVKDADNYLAYNTPENANFIVGIDVYDWPGEIRELKNKSFLQANEQGQLLDVVEKRICSSVVGLGAYGFESADDFRRAFRALCDPVYGLTTIYVSELIAYLIGVSGKLFEYVKATDYRNWGNSFDLQQAIHDTEAYNG